MAPGSKYLSTMIERIYLDNIRTFVNFEWKPAKLALILGGNGSGKTALLATLRAIRRFVGGQYSSEEAFPATSLTRWEDKRTDQTVEIDLRVGTDLFGYRLVIAQNPKEPGANRVKHESLRKNGELCIQREENKLELAYEVGWPQLSIKPTRSAMDIGDNRTDAPSSVFQSAVWHLWFLQPDARQMTARLADSPQGESSAWLRHNFSNFADWYLRILQTRPKSVFSALRTLEEIIPGLQELHADSGWLYARFESEGKTASFRFDELSDGQRALIALHLLRHVAATPGSVLALDEPDNYVALAEIQPWLLDVERAALKSGGPQVWLISHHPEVINLLAPEYGVRFFRDGMGPTRTAPFQAAQQLSASETVARGWDNEP
jgi:predicted ATPase